MTPDTPRLKSLVVVEVVVAGALGAIHVFSLSLAVIALSFVIQVGQHIFPVSFFLACTNET